LAIGPPGESSFHIFDSARLENAEFSDGAQHRQGQKEMFLAELSFLCDCAVPTNLTCERKTSLSLLISRVQDQFRGARERSPFRLFTDKLFPPEKRELVIPGALAFVG
jgi:hypothetical protein